MEKLSVTNFLRCQNLVVSTNGMDPAALKSGRDWVEIDACAARVVLLNNISNSMQKSEVFEEEMGVDDSCCRLLFNWIYKKTRFCSQTTDSPQIPSPTQNVDNASNDDMNVQ